MPFCPFVRAGHPAALRVETTPRNLAGRLTGKNCLQSSIFRQGRSHIERDARILRKSRLDSSEILCLSAVVAIPGSFKLDISQGADTRDISHPGVIWSFYRKLPLQPIWRNNRWPDCNGSGRLVTTH